MPVYVNDNGTLRECDDGVYVNDNGTLRTITTIYVNDNSTLRTIHVSRLNDPDMSVSTTGTDAGNVVANIHSDGTYTTFDDGVEESSGTWLNYGAAGDYEIFVTGTGDDPGNTDEWIALDTDPAWQISAPADGTNQFNGTFTIRDIATETTYSSGSVSLSATRFGV